MKIPLKQQHLDDGILCSHEGCALALAIREATGDNGYCVGLTKVYHKTKINLYIPLTPQMHQIRRQFDHGKHVEPCEFDLNLPPT